MHKFYTALRVLIIFLAMELQKIWHDFFLILCNISGACATKRGRYTSVSFSTSTSSNFRTDETVSKKSDTVNFARCIVLATDSIVK